MNKSTKAAAVAAVAALAMSGATGTAAAQSGILPDLGDLNPLAGSEAFPSSASPLGGSSDLTGLGSSDLLGGSSDLTGLGSSDLLGGSSTLSAEPLGGSSDLPALSAEPLGGSSDLTGVGSTALLEGSSELAPITGSEGMGSLGMAPLSTELLGGSATFDSSDLAPLTGSEGMGSEDFGSTGMTPLSTELNFLGGSAELPALSANFPDGSTAGIGGSAERIGEGVSGSLTNGSAGDITGPLGGSIDDGGSLEPIVGSIAEGGILPALSGSIDNTSGSLSDPELGLLGSVTGNGGSTGGSAEVLTGSFGDLTGVNGSLTTFTGSLENGSNQGMGSTNVGSAVGQDSSLESLASIETSVGGGLLPILSIGGAGALAGAALAGAAGGQLPPLPGVHVPGICDLPHDMVDQLANSGSAIAMDCPHPENEGN